MSVRNALEQVIQNIQYPSDGNLRALLRDVPNYDDIATLLSNNIAVRNAVTLAHPVDDLKEVFYEPDNNIGHSPNMLDDERLAGFMKTIVVAIIALMSQHKELSYEEQVSCVLTQAVLDYLSAHGRSLATYSYDDAYMSISSFL